MENAMLEFEPSTAVNVTVMPRHRRPPREYLTEREIEKLIDAAGENRWGHRDATAILIAYRHGLRSSELVALRWDDIDFRTGKLHVRRAKGGQPAFTLSAGESYGPCAGYSVRRLQSVLCIRLRTTGTAKCGWLSAHGREGWRGSEIPLPDPQPHAAPFLRLQAGQ